MLSNFLENQSLAYLQVDFVRLSFKILKLIPEIVYKNPIFFVVNFAESAPLNAYCWVYSTFTVKRHLKGIIGRHFVAPGVAQAIGSDEIFQHKYYQWVSLLFKKLFVATISH